MKLVVLEKVSLGNDIDISFFEEFGDVTYYDTTTSEQVAERVKDAEIIIANKAPLNESTLAGAKNLKLISETATGYNNVDLEYCQRFRRLSDTGRVRGQHPCTSYVYG